MRTSPWRAAAAAVLLLFLLSFGVLAQDPTPGQSPSPEPVASAQPGTPVPSPAVDPAATPGLDRSAGPGTRRTSVGLAAGGAQPVVTLSLPANARSLTVAIKLPTTDPGGSGIKGWFVSENPATPGPAANWKTVKPTTLTLSAGQGPRTVYAWARTKSGAVSERASDTVLLDQTPPTITLTAPATASARTITISLDATDPLTNGTDPASGVTRWAVVVGTVAPGKDSQAWKAVAPTSFKLSAGNGDKTISAFARDAAGNVSTASAAVVALGVAGPSLTLTLPAATTKRAVSVKLKVTDPGATGIAGYYLSSDGTVPTSGAVWSLLPTTFTLPAGDGTKTVYAWAKDNNGTISPRAEASTALDTTAPAASLTAAATTTTIALAVSITASDPGTGASGIDAYAVVNGIAVPAAASPAWTKVKPTSVVLSYGNGTKTFSLFVRDLAGNVSPADTHTVAMTLPAPTLTFSVVPLTRVLTPAVTVTPADGGGTGIAGYFLSENPTTPALNAAGWAIFPSTATIANVQGGHTVYAWVKDKNGSISSRQQDDTSLDSVKPVIALTAPFATRPSAITITIDATDVGGSGVTHWAIVAGTNVPATGAPEWKTVAPTSFTLSANDGSKTITAFARDAAGNVSVAATKVVIVDNVKPSVTLAAPAATAVRPLAVTVGGSDGSGSGITAWAIVDGTTPPDEASLAWVAPAPTTFTLSPGDATRTISAFSRDAAGNVSLAGTSSVLLDTTAPTVSLTTPTFSNSTTPWVALDGSDGSGSGITHWAVVTGTTQPAPGSGAWVTSKPASITVSAGDGPKTVSAWSRDAVGNVSLIHTNTIVIDTVAPTVGLSPLATRTKDRTIAVSLMGSDDMSGIAKWAVTEGASAPGFGSNAWKTTKPTQYTLSGPDGTRTVRAWTRDNAGNVSAASVQTIVLDTTAPSITFTTPATSAVRPISLTISGSDGGTGITDWAVVEGSTQPAANDPAWLASPDTTFTLPPGDGSTAITVFARDLVGNVGSVTRNVILDTTAPSATLLVTTPVASHSVPVTVDGSDGAEGSGITAYAVVEGTSAPDPGSASWVASAPTSIVVSGGDGSKTISAFTRDALNHVSLAATHTAVVDTAAPTVTLTAPASTTTQSIAITVASGDPGGSGVVAWAVVEGTIAPAPDSGLWVGSAPTSFNLTAGLGSKTVSAFARDAAGNVSVVSTKTVSLMSPP